jgi:hypothetical protein
MKNKNKLNFQVNVNMVNFFLITTFLNVKMIEHYTLLIQENIKLKVLKQSKGC